MASSATDSRREESLFLYSSDSAAELTCIYRILDYSVVIDNLPKVLFAMVFLFDKYEER